MYNAARRAALYIEAQRMLYDQVPVIPLVYPQSMVALDKRVEGYRSNPFNTHDFRAVGVK
jgi:dipeptide transport system substrate-binding protein